MAPPVFVKVQALGDPARRIDRARVTQSELERLHLDRAPRDAATTTVPISFEQLYREHFDFTVRTLRHLGVPPGSLLDAVQDLWLVVHRQLTSFEGRSSHRTWLFSIALNTARQQLRWQRRHRQRWTALQDDLPDPRLGPEGMQASREAFELVRAFLDTLDEPRRALFISQLLEQLDAGETAELLGIERTQVYHRVRDLRRAFKRWVLSRQGGSE